MKQIAYLAPEIPALSATFVYNEILALQAMGYQIIPLSVHFPQHIAEDQRVASLRSTTYYLYRNGLAKFLLSAWFQLLTAPNRTMECLRTLVQDIKQVGLFSRTGLG
ncbi:MAG: hypothetical protein JZU65_18470, partial [Chlorobium sp.]|nr:hypothetical protein [Chlorobium sp.]